MSDPQGSPPPNTTAPTPDAMDFQPASDTAHELGATDASLDKLDTRLSAALGDLLHQNRQVEDYLEYLAEERRRELRKTDAEQLTLDDIPADQPSERDEAPDSQA